MSNERDPTEEMLLAGIAAVNRTEPYLSDAQCVAEIWKAMQAASAASPKVPQGVEEWIANAQVQLGDESPAGWGNYIPSSEARAYLSGMALVPVDDLDAIAEVVRGMLHTAYQNAMPVCCGKPGQQCCGNPDPEWSAEDMKVMDSLGPIEKRISAMLAAAKERGE